MNAMSGRPLTSNLPIACSLPVYILNVNKVKPKLCLGSFRLASAINTLQVSVGEDLTHPIGSNSPESEEEGLSRLEGMSSCPDIQQNTS